MRRSRRRALIAGGAVGFAWLVIYVGTCLANSGGDAAVSNCMWAADKQGPKAFDRGGLHVTFKPGLPPDFARAICHFDHGDDLVVEVLPLYEIVTRL